MQSLIPLLIVATTGYSMSIPEIHNLGLGKDLKCMMFGAP